MKKQKLFDEFTAPSYAQWLEIVKKELKGNDPLSSLDVELDEQLFFNSCQEKNNLSELENSFARTKSEKNNNWRIRQNFSFTDKQEQLNANILEALYKGAECIGITNCNENIDFEKVLNEVLLDLISLHIHSRGNAHTIKQKLISYLQSKNYEIASLSIVLETDEIGTALLEKSPIRFTPDLAIFSQKLPFFKSISVNVNEVHNHGASAIVELAYALALGNEYIHRQLEAAIHIDDALSNMCFQFSVSHKMLKEIAKLRAFKMLWALLAESYKVEHECSKIATMHCQTSGFYFSVKDENNNMIRNSLAAMAATMGACDSLYVIPHDVLTESAPSFSNRISLNIQHLLKHESHIDKVLDPAGGSVYIENLSLHMAQKAWELFKEIEKIGGITVYAEKGRLHQLIQADFDSKKQKLHENKIHLIGVNKFESKTEKTKKSINNISRLAAHIE